MNALDTASTAMKAHEHKLEVVANNMSNIGTTGFKKGETEFKDLLYQTVKEPGGGEAGVNQNPVGVQIGVGVQVGGVYSNYEQGPMNPTGKPMDIAINGEGFFMVQRPNGQLAYTRDGTFKLDPQGRVVTTAGMALVPNIQVPPNTATVKISPQGQVVALNSQGQETQIGQIQIANFINPSGLKNIGSNLAEATTAAGPPTQGNPGDGVLGVLAQGMLEGSNVSPTEAVMDMIKAQRGFETNAKIMNVADQMWSTVNNVGTK